MIPEVYSDGEGHLQLELVIKIILLVNSFDDLMKKESFQFICRRDLLSERFPLAIPVAASQDMSRKQSGLFLCGLLLPEYKNDQVGP